MKKMIFKIVLLIFIILSILIPINHRWVNTEVYLLKDKKYNTLNVPNVIDICNVGSSHGEFAFNYSDISDYNCFNFSRALQPFYYDLQFLRYHKNKLHKGSVIFIPISYFSYYNEDDPQFLEHEDEYNYYLPFWMVRGFSFETVLRKSWLLILYINTDEIKYLFKDNKGIINNEINSFNNNAMLDHSTGEINISKLEEERDRTILLHSRSFKNGVNENAIIDLHTLLQYCEKLDYKPILITTPFSEYYRNDDVFDERFLQTFYSTTEMFCEKYNLEYWDYSDDYRFSDIYLYYDDDHLNNTGAKLFTKIVVERAEREGYLQ